MNAKEEKIRLKTAIVKAAVKIACNEREEKFPEDIDKLVMFIISNKGYDHIDSKCLLSKVISDFLGERLLWSPKIYGGTYKLLVKTKDNVWQVDFANIHKNVEQGLIVKKLSECEDKIDNVMTPCTEEENRIGNILKDFEEHKKKNEQEKNMKKDNNMMQTSTHSSKNPQPQTPEPEKERSFCDFLFGLWPDEYFVVNEEDKEEVLLNRATKFHACTQRDPWFRFGFGRCPDEYYVVKEQKVLSEKKAKFHACMQPDPRFHE